MPPRPPDRPADPPAARLAGEPPAPLLIADWTRAVFIHFTLPAEVLAPHVPLPLDTIDGRAFLSLVSFDLQRLRPGRWMPAALGRALLRPISEHGFINLRTYVRGPAGPGIHFLTEWINNPLSLRLGPLAYGLPYRLARLERVDLPAGGLTQIRAAAARAPQGPGLGITVPFDPAAPLAPCAAGSMDAFLVERYTAYTHRRGRTRFFHIDHAPWPMRRIDLVRTDTALVEQVYPWFKHAEPHSAHLSPGVRDVVIGRPHLCRASRPARVPAPVGAPAPDAAPAAAPSTAH